MGRGVSNPRRANGYRRDQVRRRVLAEESDCWLCNLPVDKALGIVPGRHSSRCIQQARDCNGCVYDPKSPVVDEVKPVALGGDPLARANCRLAHRRRLQPLPRRRHSPKAKRIRARHDRPPMVVNEPGGNPSPRPSMALSSS